VVINFQVV